MIARERMLNYTSKGSLSMELLLKLSCLAKPFGTKPSMIRRKPRTELATGTKMVNIEFPANADMHGTEVPP